MRPDAINWRNTNELDSLAFFPRHVVYHRIPRWITYALLLQLGLGTAIYCGIHLNVAADQWAHSLFEPLEKSLRSAQMARDYPSLASLAANHDVKEILVLLASQLAALAVVQLAVVMTIANLLSRRTKGLEELFAAIRAMATGDTPKPLAAGQPGEVGFLALAFNDMTAKLLSHRKALVEANQTLERKVEARTHELRAAAEKLDRMASTDALTGLANRRALGEDGQDKFSASVREGSDLVCLLIDLDNFKSVNDTLGHKQGDELIKLAAEILKKSCRGHDLPARLGGDEFIVIMPLDEIGKAVAIADRLRGEFDAQVKELFAAAANLKKLPSMSVGVTSRKSAQVNTFDELIQRADAALYRAKEHGKGRSEVYTRPAA